MKKLQDAHLRKVGHEGGAHLSEAGRIDGPKGCPLHCSGLENLPNWITGRGGVTISPDVSGCSVRVQVHCAPACKQVSAAPGGTDGWQGSNTLLPVLHPFYQGLT